jgi:hypothetical protein
MSEPVHEEVARQEDVLARPLLLRIGLATVMVGLALCVVAYLIMWGRERALRPSMHFPERDAPAPHAVSGVREELFELAHPAPDLKARQRASLSKYGWVDRSRGLVRIPIERAMDVVAGQVTEASR